MSNTISNDERIKVQQAFLNIIKSLPFAAAQPDEKLQQFANTTEFALFSQAMGSKQRYAQMVQTKLHELKEKGAQQPNLGLQGGPPQQPQQPQINLGMASNAMQQNSGMNQSQLAQMQLLGLNNSTLLQNQIQNQILMKSMAAASGNTQAMGGMDMNMLNMMGGGLGGLQNMGMAANSLTSINPVGTSTAGGLPIANAQSLMVFNAQRAQKQLPPITMEQLQLLIFQRQQQQQLQQHQQQQQQMAFQQQQQQQAQNQQLNALLQAQLMQNQQLQQNPQMTNFLNVAQQLQAGNGSPSLNANLNMMNQKAQQLQQQISQQQVHQLLQPLPQSSIATPKTLLNSTQPSLPPLQTLPPQQRISFIGRFIERLMAQSPKVENLPLSREQICAAVGMSADKLPQDYANAVNEELLRRLKVGNAQAGSIQQVAPSPTPLVAAPVVPNQPPQAPVQVSPEDLQYIKNLLQELRIMVANSVKLLPLFQSVPGKESQIIMLNKIKQLAEMNFAAPADTVYITRANADVLKAKLTELYNEGEKIVLASRVTSAPTNIPPSQQAHAPSPKLATNQMDNWPLANLSFNKAAEIVNAFQNHVRTQPANEAATRQHFDGKLAGFQTNITQLIQLVTQFKELQASTIHPLLKPQNPTPVATPPLNAKSLPTGKQAATVGKKTNNSIPKLPSLPLPSAGAGLIPSVTEGKKLLPSDMKTEIKTMLSEMGQNGVWRMEGLDGETKLVKIGFNYHLQDAQVVNGGVDSVPVDAKFQNLTSDIDESFVDNDMEFVLGTDFVVPTVRPFNASEALNLHKLSIEEEVRSIESRFNVKGVVLDVGVANVVVSFSNARAEMTERVVFTIQEKKLYEERCGEYNDDGKMADSDELMEVDVEGFGLIDVCSSGSRRMFDVLTELYA
ncbi:hypothetical protein HDU79_009140 [Rhizoclosmatium sp. JEL0117]|nr:hypothetical protein HDU79_009140 [Rhizoclosmatium sp. JEL0117]